MVERNLPLKSAYLSCEVGQGLFPDERVVAIHIDEQSRVSGFLRNPKDVTTEEPLDSFREDKRVVRGKVRVTILEETDEGAVVSVFADTFNGQMREILVPWNLLSISPDEY